MQQRHLREVWEEFFSKKYIVGEYSGWLDDTQNIFLKAKTVLDIGCGDGNDLSYISDKYPDITLYGIDISETALKYLINKKKMIILNTFLTRKK